MPQFSRTWWGQRFIAALEAFTDPARLGRGRSYASNGKVKDYRIDSNGVTAHVRGSVNPYFGVYKEPLYTVTIALTPIAERDWSATIDRIGSNARLVTALLMNEMPDTIEEAFATDGLALLPRSRREIVTTCSCPDDANPCKHTAGVYYLLAFALDSDPFLLFELRGLSRQRLHEELSHSSLGQILSSVLTEESDRAIEPDTSYYTVPTTAPAEAGDFNAYRTFWNGAQRLPPLEVAPPRHHVPALLIKKQGDYPAFWHKDASFIGVMEELYERVRLKSGELR